jgi:hypothetical protein
MDGGVEREKESGIKRRKVERQYCSQGYRN